MLDRYLGLARWWRAAAAAIGFAALLAPAAVAQAQTCGTTTWNLTAGQTIDVGSVTVSNDASNLYVTYTLDSPGALFGTLHLWVGNDILTVPANPQGTPVPGQFPYHFDAIGQTTHTFVIPFTDLSIADVASACPLQLYVVAHAEVAIPHEDDDGYDTETAFGGPNPGGGPRWWFYGVYTVCCEFGPPPVPVCTTAFGYGTHVWTTDKKSNPDKLPSLNLTRNRWGWASNVTGTGGQTVNLWAGAGLNKTANGALAGTVTIAWSGTQATVTYLMATGYLLDAAHVYVGDTAPTTIAPGQYGNVTYFPDGTSSYMITVDVTDTNGDGIWVVAHGVVCK